jgi:hypothetical protein
VNGTKPEHSKNLGLTAQELFQLLGGVISPPVRVHAKGWRAYSDAQNKRNYKWPDALITLTLAGYVTQQPHGSYRSSRFFLNRPVEAARAVAELIWLGNK